MSNKRLIDGEKLLNWANDYLHPLARKALEEDIESGKLNSFSNQGEAARLLDELEDQRVRANIAHANAEAKSARITEFHSEVARLREALEKIANNKVAEVSVWSKILADIAREALSSHTEDAP